MAEEKAPIQEGGPGAPAPVAEGGGLDVTKTVKIKLAGKEFDVDPALASAYEAREQEFQRKVSQHGEELGFLRKFKQETEPILTQLRNPSGQQNGPNLSLLWYQDPEAAANVVEERITRKMQAQYLQAEGIKSFWDGFYSENKDLTDDKFVVKAMFSELYGELAPLTIREAQKKLADATRDELLRISRKVKSDTKPNRSGDLEEASGERLAKPTKEEIEEAKGPKSISELIKSRTQSRRAAKTVGKTG